MIMRVLPLAALLLASCGGEAPQKKDNETKAAKAEPAIDTELRQEKKSIEEAADAAAKLVEADAKAEIDALGAE
jgi:outer membrane biogenesis lipoprotein LolB